MTNKHRPMHQRNLLTRRFLRPALENLLQIADIRLNFTRPWDLKVKNERLFRRLLLSGWLGLRDAYVDGDWESADLEELMFRALASGLGRIGAFCPGSLMSALALRVFERVLPPRPHLGTDAHREMPYGFYSAFLDPYRQYGPGYFRGTGDLASAQKERLARIGEKLRIGPDDHVLDLGCGWGGFARFAVERYGCRVTGVTPSRDQAYHAGQLTHGLRVEIREGDFRSLTGRYDKILVSGTLEHLPQKHRPPLIHAMHRCVARNGRVLVEAISQNAHAHGEEDRLTARPLFEATLPSPSEVTAVVQGPFAIASWESLSDDYVLTLRAWRNNLMRRTGPLRPHYDARTLRAWDFHFASTAALFRIGERHASHILLTNPVSE
jgi:cyclopropane-fatty-acyl-phospholipid synthase